MTCVGITAVTTPNRVAEKTKWICVAGKGQRDGTEDCEKSICSNPVTLDSMIRIDAQKGFVDGRFRNLGKKIDDLSAQRKKRMMGEGEERAGQAREFILGRSDAITLQRQLRVRSTGWWLLHVHAALEPARPLST